MAAIKYSSAVTCNLIAGLFSNHKAGDLCPGIAQTDIRDIRQIRGSPNYSAPFRVTNPQ